MAITVLQIKRKIGEFLSRDKPEPYLAMLFDDGIEVKAIDWLISIGARREKEFWILSRSNAQKATHFRLAVDWSVKRKADEERLSVNY